MRLGLRPLFTFAIFLGSFLLFLVQPLAAKMILPTFGGTPAVWNTSMVFFQGALLLGYAYAHASVARLGIGRQPWIHLLLMVLSLAVLPVSVPVGLVSGGASNPALQVLLVLALGVGLPFFAVSAGAPLLQRWFAETDDPRASDPYFLYRASNLGSLLALLSYPAVFEPFLRLRTQAIVWTAMYALLILAVAGCALQATRFHRDRALDRSEPERASEPIPWRRRLFWVVLAAVPSSLLLGVTTYLTSNLTPIPLLWVVPLAVYLLTFIVAFQTRRTRVGAVASRLLPLIAAPMALAVVLESSEPLWLLGLLHLLLFAVAALALHRRLAEDRPPADRLTEFYLWVSVGGVLGGAFNALLAPVAFSRVAEYPIAIVLACLLTMPRKGEGSVRWADLAYPAMVAGVAYGGWYASRRTEWISHLAEGWGLDPGPLGTLAMLGLPALLAFLAVDRRLRFGLSLGALFLVSFGLHVYSKGNVTHTARSFFGVTRIVETRDGRLRQLVHGNTLHGLQNLEPGLRNTPMTYYHPTGPIGEVFEAMGPALRGARIGLVGLGVGSLAAYGQPGQQMVFFEIDPLVERIARDDRLFTFLRDSKAEVRVVLGDARLMLEREPDASFRLLVLDAFSSDSIPVHLLTREAMRLYQRKLEPNGVLAFHVSNRYLVLHNVVAKTALAEGMVSAYHDDAFVDDELALQGKTASQWVVAARSWKNLQPILHGNPAWEKLTQPDGPVWSDDFSNLLSVFER
ncbi:MAG: fused MFS/spermidine synthase [Fimbriimonadales bacterium]|nr:fused MFS/spermidine synthase [Fimbriimonadales bacterium]